MKSSHLGHLALAFLCLNLCFPAQAKAAPCTWPRCTEEAAARTPQLCAKHLEMHTTPAGEKLSDLIWKNDAAAIRKQAVIAGPDYLIRGAPPLVHAVYADHPEAAMALIQVGAYTKWKTWNGKNLVYFSAMQNKPRMAQFFIAQGAGTLEDARAGGMDAAQVAVIADLMKQGLARDVGKTLGTVKGEGRVCPQCGGSKNLNSSQGIVPCFRCNGTGRVND